MKGGLPLTPRTGRPKAENPRSEQVSIYLTKEEKAEVEKAREKDKEPQKSLAAWFARKFFEMLRKTTKK